MTPLSILDLSPITTGSTAAESFRRTLDLARHADGWGYRRYWLAEHHGMPGIASAATSVLLAYVGAGTTRIRIGAGGVMLPNHSPLVIAEQFGTLESLFPGRVDLGLGRAPGSDRMTAMALRRGLDGDVDAFPHDVVELMDYFAGSPERVRAVPGAGLDVPIWILGSSLYGAQLAAALGLPYAFASHFAPAQLMPAIEIYRERFRPSPRHDKPYVMLGFNVYAAPTDDEARLLASSHQQAFVNLRSGRPSTLPPPRAGYFESLGGPERALIGEILSCSAVGSPATVRAAIEAFVARTGADELMLASQMYDHDARVRSYGLVAEAMGLPPAQAPASPPPAAHGTR